ncbi:cytidine deaminase [Mucilaginibacter sp. L3T2-6]|uniref:cytidine deaminase n=1 Tax=Mucilaginibacter sp. L3T2-6 TaxID=3062491 RepID=UPI0026771217|nr:cytidine deaminase [Mucilaginibacter sp. L3T2-6]MDO3641414.1 cytidine deaminase [Mucilaginibacter sp. L3T2-6]MDV6213825.1 cytidine deaminase [Mucilaginibacter sp. L3T2-6]
MTEHEIKINFKSCNTISDLSIAGQQLCAEAVKAQEGSHSPYSKFRVGAALRLQSGKIICGSNQENVAYPSGLCAERVAFFNWGANHSDDPIEAMAVTASTDEFELTHPVASCGACLQVMAEYEKKQNKPIEIILFCNNGPVWVMKGVESFLPFLFFEKGLVKAES